MRNLFVLIALLFFCGQSFAGNLYYLGIGVDYKATGNSVDTYAQDIIKMDNILLNSYSAFFSGYHRNLILADKADAAAIIDGFHWLEQSQSDDLVIVHIDCHGGDRNGYMLYPNSGTVSGAVMKKILSNVTAKIFFILDTCHSGAFIRDWGTCGPNIMIIAACESQQGSFGTYFIDSVMDGLDAADYDNDGIITIQELVRYTAWRIKAYTALQNVVISNSTLNYNLKYAA